MRRIDLHAHTTHSDGTLTPAELVARAQAVGLVALAVTDHDTLSALPEARAAGEALGVEVWDGCEITATAPEGIVHVLAYAFDGKDAALRGLLERICEAREERNVRIHARLAALGVPLAPEEVTRHAEGAIVARPHFARALVARGHVGDVREAFELYLRDDGPAYVRAEAPGAEEAIAIATRAGAATVIAHPRSLRLGSRQGYEHRLRAYREAGLVGLEVDHPSQNADQRRLFAELAEALDLVPTGGSDFHGAVKPHIELGSGDGSIEVGYETWERLMAGRRS